MAFSRPVTHVYNPLSYAWHGYATYLRRFANGRKRVVFLGMNPGPFGMVQTGVPFGEITAVRGWLGIAAKIRTPALEHPRRPIQGLECTRSEVSGQRLWSLFAQRFESAPDFFAQHLVLNYCPLAFLEESGRNRTPDKLAPSEREALFAACDRHLRRAIEALQPEWLIGIGDFAARRAEVFRGTLAGLKLGKVLHPSPASPAANRGWAAAVTRELQIRGVWS